VNTNAGISSLNRNISVDEKPLLILDLPC